jgi:hypothetical protein
MLAPARMAAVVAARVALPRASGGTSGELVAGEMVRARVRPRNDLRETPARMGWPSVRSSS